jgi:hypothetical protein
MLVLFKTIKYKSVMQSGFSELIDAPFPFQRFLPFIRSEFIKDPRSRTSQCEQSPDRYFFNDAELTGAVRHYSINNLCLDDISALRFPEFCLSTTICADIPQLGIAHAWKPPVNVAIVPSPSLPAPIPQSSTDLPTGSLTASAVQNASSEHMIRANLTTTQFR